MSTERAIISTLSPQDRHTLSRLAVQAGISDEEAVATLRSIDDKAMFHGFSNGILEVGELLRGDDRFPPPPPYELLFDDKSECDAFRWRAMAAHNVTLSIVTVSDGGYREKYRLVEVTT